MRSIERQKALLKNARAHEMETLRKIEKADIFYENDRGDFQNIILAESFEASWSMYTWLDTVAREQLMEIIEKKESKFL